jgi:hypothetical protein
MTEQVMSTEISSQPVASESSNVSSAPQVQEKMLRQSEVNEIIGKVKHEAYSKGLAERPAPVYSAPVQQQPQYAAQPGMNAAGIAPTISEEHLRKLIAEENAKSEYAKNYERLVGSFIGKLEQGKNKYEDFEQVVAPLELPKMPVIWQAAETFDNPAAIVYALGKKPGKLAQLLNLAHSPELVRREMKELSESLQQNESAKEEKAPNAPISRPKPSNVGMGNGDASTLSAQDWKKILRV